MTRNRNWICNSTARLDACIDDIRKMWSADHYLQITAKSGKTRSLDQNALLHIWCRELVAHISGIDEREVTDAQIQDMKTALKNGFYRDTGSSYVLRISEDALTGKTAKTLQSTREYSREQMGQLLDWVQALALVDFGLLLESLGEFADSKNPP